MASKVYPIPFNESEAMLFRFFDPLSRHMDEWRVSTDPSTASVSLDEIFHAASCRWDVQEGPVSITLRRETEIEVQGYNRLALCVHSGSATTVSVYADVDGRRPCIVDHAAGNDAGQELEGPIGGKRISAIEIVFTDPADYPGMTNLFWMGAFDAARREEMRGRQLPYPEDWADLTVPAETLTEEPRPQLELFFGADELGRLRAKVESQTCLHLTVAEKRINSIRH